MTRRQRIERLTALREALLPVALRIVWTTSATPEDLALKACQLAHTVAATALEFDRIHREEEDCMRRAERVHRANVKHYKKTVQDDDDAALGAIIKGTP